MQSPFSRLSLLSKIMLSTSVAITMLFAITGEIVVHKITRTMSDSLQEEVRSSFQAYTSLWKARAEMLTKISRLIGGMSDFRAVVGTRDQATIRDSASELWSTISDSNAVFLVTDVNGKIIASLGGDAAPLGSRLDLVKTAAVEFPEQASGFFLHAGSPSELYQVSVTPVYVQSTRRQEFELLGVLVAGFRADALVAQQLKQATGSEFLFQTPGEVLASTLNPRATSIVQRRLAKARESELIGDGLSEYAWFQQPLTDISGRPVAQITVLRSFDAARRRIADLYTNIILVWLVAVAAGLAMTYLLARRIVEPVKQLDRAAAEVARQNYAIRVHVSSQDEMGRLARTFNDMCASIRQAREDLIQQERLSTIGRLSASMVHDLRNPLAAIYGGAEMLVDTDLPPSHVKRLAGNIYRASRRIQELLQDLLNVSRGRTQAMEMCRLREVAAAACESLATAAEAQRVEVALEIPPEIELPLERSRMERVFVNLIGNSLEAMPEGGAVRISTEVRDGAAIVHVADNGPGIAPEIRSRLFQPFVTAGKRNGMGLGLALTRQTVTEHGGEMWVESEPGRGARFSFRLPGAQVAQPQGLQV
jgi:signal transduction histidine kinase